VVDSLYEKAQHYKQKYLKWVIKIYIYRLNLITFFQTA